MAGCKLADMATFTARLRRCDRGLTHDRSVAVRLRSLCSQEVQLAEEHSASQVGTSRVLALISVSFRIGEKEKAKEREMRAKGC